MDKPPPYRRSAQGYDDNYPQASVIPRESGTVSNVTNKVFEAYKINPVMIAMIVLLLTILAALGFYMMRNDDRIYAYIGMRDRRESDLYDRLIEMSLHCRDKEFDKNQSYPDFRFPPLATGGDAVRKPESTRR
jgi:hypothetical protein